MGMSFPGRARSVSRHGAVDTDSPASIGRRGTQATDSTRDGHALDDAGEDPRAQCPTGIPSPGYPPATQDRTISGPDHPDPGSRQGHAEEAAAHGQTNL